MNKHLITELLEAAQDTSNSIQKKQKYLEIPLMALSLEKDISTKQYVPSRYTCFVIADPTPREILAPDFRDRIVNRWVVNSMEPYIDKRFLDCSYANRKGKGHHRAVIKLYHYMHNPANKYYLKMDICNFFNSINHNILVNLIDNWISKMPITNKDTLSYVAETIIRHNPTKNCIFSGNINKLKIIPPAKSYFNNPEGIGLPLGNLSSQFFANIYLHELDFFVKQKLGVKYYIRYVDDFVILSDDIYQLKIWKKEIEDFLINVLKLTPHPKKTISQKLSNGIDFLGYYIKPTHILVRRRVVNNFKRKLNMFSYTLQRNEKNPNFKQLLSKVQASINSYYGIFQMADTHRLCIHLYSNHFDTFLKKYFSLSIDNDDLYVQLINYPNNELPQ
jgi:RNA-directed DNA polymerase